MQKDQVDPQAKHRIEKGRIVSKELISINRFIMLESQKYPEATGEFAALMTEIVLTSKVISSEVNKAGLIEILGLTGDINVQGRSPET